MVLLVLEIIHFTIVVFFKNITLPNSLKSIGNYAFDSCTSFKSIFKNWSASAISMFGFFIQFAFLTITVGSFTSDFILNWNKEENDGFSEESSSSKIGFGLALLFVVMTSIALSRFGSWMGDNAMQLILQKTVSLDKISSVNGALTVLYNFWSSLGLIVSIFTPVSLFLVAVGFSCHILFSSTLIFFIFFLKNPKKSNKHYLIIISIDVYYLQLTHVI